MATFLGSVKKNEIANTSLSSIKTQSQHEPSSPCRQTTPRITCRSVKSIVAWLESSSVSQQSWSPSTAVSDIPHDPSTSSTPTYHRQMRPKERVSAASDVEDYSLTYLQYREYFTSAPLGRSLDQTRENDLPSARGWLAREAVPVSKQHGGDDERGRGAGGGIDDSDEEHVGKHKTTAFPGFIQREPDEVKAF
ncbi:hypothetical protein E4U43_001318 [Claviceps pusilla]|uniref:Uncharacterized protein n=1 Tax=Claviceps pusilla TaxID=123648 RepID=A0A9P7NAD1_9HYPO|nr:hypothetical protein E4U43_001318 [Claviceps pusilla]